MKLLFRIKGIKARETHRLQAINKRKNIEKITNKRNKKDSKNVSSHAILFGHISNTYSFIQALSLESEVCVRFTFKPQAYLSLLGFSKW